MARIVEDSDDELPSLEDIVKKSNKRPQVKLSSAATQQQKASQAKNNQNHTNTTTATKSVKDGPSNERETSNLESKKLKRRVLSKTTPSIFTSELLQTKSRTRKAPKKVVTPAWPFAPPSVDLEEGEYDEDSDGLLDFFVNDSSASERDGSELEEPHPRSTRRLVRGRRLSQTQLPSIEKLGSQFDKVLRLDEDEFEKGGSSSAGNHDDDSRSQDNVYLQSSGSNDVGTVTQQAVARGKGKVSKSKAGKDDLKSDVDDPSSILRYSPSENKTTKVSRKASVVMPPPSPEHTKSGLASPKKLPRIPQTPHRPSMDSFWNQDVINDWNDEYSPIKALKAIPSPQKDQKQNPLLFSPKKSPSKQDRITKEAKKSFSQKKQELAHAFLLELDREITDSQVSKLAASTGGVKILWSKKLNTTAGRANWKRETIKSSTLGPDGKPNPPTYRHHASIELAEKVIDDENRLLNVIAHEFCHLANFMISNIKTNPHGKEFKAWAAKCSREFGHRGIEVTTKHSYTIEYKYVWECTNCGAEFKRHSKSIDPALHQCGTCKSKLVQTKPIPRNGVAKVSEYQMFVKENMKKVKEENKNSPQKEIMALVGKKYQEHKASKLGGLGLKNGSDGEKNEMAGGKEEVVDLQEDVDVIARKLDFLDLTSP